MIIDASLEPFVLHEPLSPISMYDIKLLVWMAIIV
jgi:hypothetical protein